jgi:TonB family protein
MKASQDFKFTVPPEKRTEIFARNLEKLAGRPIFVEVTGPVIPAKELRQLPKPVVPPLPLYPPKLAGSGKTGLVTIKFVINTEGQAVNPDIVSREGEPVFTTLALVQVLRARWEPAKHKGKLVNVEMTVPMNFQEQPPEGRPPPAARPGGGGGDGG